MPERIYWCPVCKREFEHLELDKDDKPVCKCGNKELIRRPTAFAIQMR